ncbi:MAG TPA: sulfatase, partial [Thermoanaerobaculia bacterium]|nr:sulfatase [Thermoanaerobaculia bacterium]
MKTPSLLLFVSAALALTAACGQPDPTTPTPHATGSVLLITLDTTRADRLGAYGSSSARTPTLDNLAAAGTLFENAYAVAPLTLPAHASMLTGAYPPEHGVRNNGIHALAEEWTTLPEILAADGVRTAAVVAATVLDRRYGLAQGFEHYDDELRAERTSAAAVDRPAGAVTDAARRWLDGVGSDERFFLWVHYFDPHAPYAPPEGYRDLGEPYDGEIAYMDAEIGRLLEHRRLAGDERLTVIVVGDHGESLGEHGELTHGMLVYDSTLRIPWIVHSTADAAGERRADRVDQ